MPDPGNKSTDLERVREGLRSDDTHQFLRALEAVLMESLRSQLIASKDAGAVQKQPRTRTTKRRSPI